MSSCENIIKNHNDAFLHLETIISKIKKDKINSGQINPSSDIQQIYETDLKSIKNYDNNKIILIDAFKILKKYESFEKKDNGHIKNLKKYKFIKSVYNNKINKLHTIIKPDSILNNICFLNESLLLIGKKLPKQKTCTDVLTLEKFVVNNVNPENLILKLSKGRILCEDKTYLLNCLINYVEQTELSDLVYTVDDNSIRKKNSKCSQNLWGCLRRNIEGTCYNFTLNVKIQHSSNFGENKIRETSLISSNSMKILHSLTKGFNSSNCYLYDDMTTKDIIIHDHYYKYQCIVRKKILQLIRNSYNIESFPFQIVDCIRNYPTPCRKENIIKKYNETIINNTKLFICDCGMDLCIGGCCRIYHGETNCDMTLDEASEELLKIISDKCKCPKCDAPVEKISGCNHMTCLCKAQFCYLCKKEFNKDKYDKYMIEEHYVDNDWGSSRGSCVQFTDDFPEGW